MAAFMKSVASAGEYEVLIDPDDDRIDQSFLDRVAKDVPGLKLRLSDDRRPIGGGFVMRSGRTETNCALDTILRDSREKLETDVAASLFGSGE
jgi:hypothetical protein